MTMRSRARIRGWWAHTALAVALASPAAAFAALGAPPPVVRTAAAQGLSLRAVSFAVVDLDSGRVVASLNGDTPRSPASTIKLLTTFASLDLLGPAFVWHTRALLRGELNDGVLNGDLVLQGGGDPYMTLERWWSFVHMLRARGLKTIHGDIVIDNTAFALPPEDPGSFDGRPNRTYNVLPDALMVNFQSIEFRVAPNAQIGKVEIVATPAPVNLSDRQSHRICDRPLPRAGSPGGFRGRLRAVGSRRFRRRLVGGMRGAQHHPRAAQALPNTRSARFSNCGGSWAASSAAHCASRLRRRTPSSI